jgi:hypothetical protein
VSYTVLQIIEVRCPGLYADPGRDIYISLAEQQISSCYFGDNRNLAVALQACHDYSVGQRGGDAGTISSKKEGDLAVTYSAGGGVSTDLGQTSFGLALQRLIRKSGGGAISVTGAQNIPCLNPGIVPCE